MLPTQTVKTAEKKIKPMEQRNHLNDHAYRSSLNMSSLRVALWQVDRAYFLGCHLGAPNALPSLDRRAGGFIPWSTSLLAKP